MKIILLVTGETKTSYLRQGIDQYFSRLKHYIPSELQVLPDIKASKAMTETRQKELEGQQMLQSLQPGDYVALLDERGKEMTSREFSAWSTLAWSQASTPRHGYRWSLRILSRSLRPADARLSLSRMTFSHEMVRLFVAEQLYRAMTILRNEPYHHD